MNEFINSNEMIDKIEDEKLIEASIKVEPKNLEILDIKICQYIQEE